MEFDGLVMPKVDLRYWHIKEVYNRGVKYVGSERYLLTAD